MSAARPPGARGPGRSHAGTEEDAGGMGSDRTVSDRTGHGPAGSGGADTDRLGTEGLGNGRSTAVRGGLGDEAADRAGRAGDGRIGASAHADDLPAGPGQGDPVTLALVAALALDHAIGRDNALPWHLPDDLKRFKAITLGKPLLMGRRTAESLGRALPGRRNLVLTRGGRAPFAGMEAVASLDAALSLAASDGDTLCVIGGGEVYALCLPRAARMHLTWVETRVPGADAHFPRFDPARWTVVSSQAHAADARHAHAFRFVDYVLADRVAAGAGAIA